MPDADALPDDGDQVVLRVPADPRYARVVRIAASAHAVRVGLVPASVEDLRLAVDEALILLLGATTEGDSGPGASDPGPSDPGAPDPGDDPEEPTGHIVVTLDASSDRPPVTVDLRLDPGPTATATDAAALSRFEELIPVGVAVDLVDPAAGRVSLRHPG